MFTSNSVRTGCRSSRVGDCRNRGAQKGAAAAEQMERVEQRQQKPQGNRPGTGNGDTPEFIFLLEMNELHAPPPPLFVLAGTLGVFGIGPGKHPFATTAIFPPQLSATDHIPHEIFHGSGLLLPRNDSCSPPENSHGFSIRNLSRRVPPENPYSPSPFARKGFSFFAQPLCNPINPWEINHRENIRAFNPRRMLSTVMKDSAFPFIRKLIPF